MRARVQLFCTGAVLALLGPAALSGLSEKTRECDGLTSGSVILTDELALVFAVAFAEQRADLDVAFLARGEAGWNATETTFQPWLQPKLPEPTGFLTGVGIGRIFLQYDQKAGNAWVHTTKVAVRKGDVIVVDSAHTVRPVVSSVVHVPPAIPLADACRVRATDDHVTMRTAIFDMLLREPQLRDIIRQSTRNHP